MRSALIMIAALALGAGHAAAQEIDCPAGGGYPIPVSEFARDLLDEAGLLRDLSGSELLAIKAAEHNPRAEKWLSALFRMKAAPEIDLRYFDAMARAGYASGLGRMWDFYYRGKGVPQSYDCATRLLVLEAKVLGPDWRARTYPGKFPPEYVSAIRQHARGANVPVVVQEVKGDDGSHLVTFLHYGRR